MASYDKFVDTLSEGNILIAYGDLLVDINHCLNLLKSLESDRTWGEYFSDWAAGDRSKLNIPRMLIQLNELKEEVEKGNKVYTKLLLKLNSFKLLERYYFHKHEMLITTHVVNEDSKDVIGKFSECLKNLFERFSQTIEELKKTGLFEPRTEGIISKTLKHTAMGSAFLVLPIGVDIAVLLSYIGYSYVKSGGKHRGVKYQELKYLSDSLNEPLLLAIFQGCHKTSQNIIDEIDSLLETYRKHFASESETQSKKEINHTENPHIQAMKFYKNAKSTNLASLEADEPELTPEMRTKMAIRISKAECKVFLVEKLNFSESDAKEFLDCLAD